MEKEVKNEENLEMHKTLDAIVARWIMETKDLPSSSTVTDLLEWSYKRTYKTTDM